MHLREDIEPTVICLQAGLHHDPRTRDGGWSHSIGGGRSVVGGRRSQWSGLNNKSPFRCLSGARVDYFTMRLAFQVPATLIR
jgi:hypothetical protein